jgi:ankyrin repeat protein
MSSSSLPRLNLEQQRKRAKDLRRAHGGGRLDAAIRIGRHLPRARGRTPAEVLASPLTSSEAHFVVAREAGFSSWPEMRRRAAEAPPIADAAEALVDAALAGNDRLVDTLLQAHGDLTRRSMPAAAAVADTVAIAALLASDPDLADRRGGPRAWPPLLYLCYCTYRRQDADATAARAQIARTLMAAGADVNAAGQEAGLPSFNVTLFDQEEWHPLEAAAGRLASPELVRVLLDGGADVTKAPIVLSQAVRGGSLDVLQQLLGAAPADWWAVRWALLACVLLDRLDMARTIVAATSEGDPTQASPDRALLEAIQLGRGRDWIEVLLGGKHSPEATMAMRGDGYRAAVRYGHQLAADILVEHGVDPATATTVDRLIGACVTGNASAVGALLAGSPGLSSLLRDDDHRMLSWAIRRNLPGAVPLMRSAGLSPDVPDKDGNAPLHLAVQAGAVATVDLLLDAGAQVDVRNFDGRTPLDLALVHPDLELREQLTRRLLDAGANPEGHKDLGALFESAADAVVSGAIDALRGLLDQEPGLIHARSPRPHRATLLHYSVANGVEAPRQRMPPNAPEVTRLLLAHGADPNATCNLYGGGATPLGLLITSAIPLQLGLDGEMVRALTQGGATARVEDLVHCLLHGALRSAQALAEAGVPIDNLFTAAGLEQIPVMTRLLEGGADINARYQGSTTALHAAAGNGRRESVRLLLEQGADVTLRNVWGGTPASAARYFGHPDVAELIETWTKGSTHAAMD